VTVLIHQSRQAEKGLKTVAGHFNSYWESFQYRCPKEETPFARHTISFRVCSFEAGYFWYLK